MMMMTKTHLNPTVLFTDKCWCITYVENISTTSNKGLRKYKDRVKKTQDYALIIISVHPTHLHGA